MEPSFEKLLVRLADAQVRFVLVGGLAVILHGYVRLTEDVDLLVDDEPQNLRRLLEVLEGFGEGFARELSPDDFDESEGAIRIVEETELCQIDLFTRMGGRRYSDAIEDAERFSLRGRQIRYASKKLLIDWKSRSVREKDRIDAMALRSLEEDPNAFD
jgi:predicted nucleotidyltransferase